MPGSTPGPVVGIRRWMPFAGGPGRYFLIPHLTASASFTLTPAAAENATHLEDGTASFTLTATAGENVEWPVAGAASFTLTPAAFQNAIRLLDSAASFVLAAASSKNAVQMRLSLESFVLTSSAAATATHVMVAAASLTLTAVSASSRGTANLPASASLTLIPLAAKHVVRHPFALAQIVLVPTADELGKFVAASSAQIVLATVASTTHSVVASASVGLILSAVATRSNLSSINATASFTLLAICSETATFDNFLLSTPLAVIHLTATALEHRVASAAAEVSLAMAHFSAAAGGTRSGHAFATAFLILRARSRYPIPKAGVVEDYLGRFQQGAEVPLSLQCFAAAETPGLPDNAPIVRMYRDGILVDSVTLALQQDTQVAGRFGASHPLGAGDAPGRYVAAYWYTAGGVPQSQCQVFEVVPGGDPGGPVIAAQVISRPDGDRVLAELGAGMLALGQDPYLDGA